MNFKKRMTACFSALVFAGAVQCEKMNGPEPYLCQHKYSQLMITVRTSEGQVSMPAVPLDSIKKIIVTESGVHAIVNVPEYENSIPLTTLGKIVFQQ